MRIVGVLGEMYAFERAAAKNFRTHYTHDSHSLVRDRPRLADFCGRNLPGFRRALGFSETGSLVVAGRALVGSCGAPGAARLVAAPRPGASRPERNRAACVPVHSAKPSTLLGSSRPGFVRRGGVTAEALGKDRPMSFKILLLLALMAPIILIAVGALIHGPDRDLNESRNGHP